jgi:hypothetical protein
MVRLMLLLIALGTCMPAWSTGLVWLDIENRIEYGYFTEDTRALVDIAGSLPPAEGTGALREYYLALVHYRLALITASVDKNRAAVYVDRCVESTDKSLKAQADYPEALALQSICLNLTAAMKPLRAPIAAARSAKSIDRALKLAPRNPRVLLLDALRDYDRHLTLTGGKAQVIASLQRAITGFEIERREAGALPGWGAADAYVFLAGSYLDSGDTIKARDALERALLIAPEYALARRMLTRITSG